MAEEKSGPSAEGEEIVYAHRKSMRPYGIYRVASIENIQKNTMILLPTKREGGRTVGSGRVATIIE